MHHLLSTPIKQTSYFLCPIYEEIVIEKDITDALQLNLWVM